MDFEDVVDPRVSFAAGKNGRGLGVGADDEYDAWAVVGERKPSWLKGVLE